MKKIFLTAVAAIMFILTAQAQRLSCLRGGALTRADVSALPVPYDFDSHKTYRVPVVLISFSDMDFSMDNPSAYYDRLFNEPGFNEGMGLGCVADYFRDQSAGRANFQFDIYGPLKIDKNAGNRTFRDMYGDYDMKSAIEILCKTPGLDFSVYDWESKGTADIVLFIAAGYSGESNSGYIWPNTSRFIFNTQLPGGINPNFQSTSCEMWKDNSLCGIGTIIHEFCHFLGLPDIYPLQCKIYSAIDEWDLMDGGNYTNKGWCPPNLTAMELMYLGWASPEELTGPVAVEGLKPLSNGGKSYIIRNSTFNNEFYLLENRQQEGWDYGCPGNGLLIYHVNYDQYSWANNMVNYGIDPFRFDLFHADGKDFRAWCPRNDGNDLTRWTEDNQLRSSYLSTSPYPFTDYVTLQTNDSLTDSSSPAATLINVSDGRKYMGKPITDITMAADGTISFNFMKDNSTGIMPSAFTDEPETWYTIDGRRISQPTGKGLYILSPKSGNTQEKSGQKIILW